MKKFRLHPECCTVLSSKNKTSMSTDADSYRSGRSRDSIHNAVTFGVSTIIQLSFSAIPVFGQIYDVFLALTSFVDTILDPENVGSVESRDHLNKICKNNVDDMTEHISNKDILQYISTAIKKADPNITSEDLARQIKIQTSLYHLEFVRPPGVCFSDFSDGEKLAMSFSGPPTEECKVQAPDYYDAYFTYINANKEKYKADETKDPSKMEVLLTSLFTLEATKLIESEKQQYNIEFVVVGIIFTVSLLVVLTLYFVVLTKERKQKKS
jgi:hypothetical protein